MKISEIVKQTKEYERLTRVIRSIENAIKDFDKINKIENNILCTNGSITLGGGTGFFTTNDGIVPSQPTEKPVNVFLNDEVSELVRDDIKAVLKKHLAELKKQRDELEI